MRAIALVLLALAGCQQRNEVEFAKISITLPADTTTLPPGPNVELATATCLACHSADLITNQPRLTRAQWTANVEKMVTVYKANIDAKAVGPIVDYLVAMQGKAPGTPYSVSPDLNSSAAGTPNRVSPGIKGAPETAR